MLTLRAESSVAPGPETYLPHTPPEDSNCPLCRAGWPRWVAVRSGQAHHDLPKPVGTFTCVHGRCRTTTWAVGVALALAAAGILLWPFVR